MATQMSNGYTLILNASRTSVIDIETALVSKESDRRNHTDSSRRGRGSYPGQPIRYLGHLIRYPGKVVPDRGPETKKSIEFA